MEKMGIIKTMARAVPALAAAAALTLGASAAELVPVGEAVGIEVQTEGMLVAGLTAVETAGGEELCPAADCGVEPGDIITRLGSREVLTAEDFAAAAAELDGGEVTLTLAARRENDTVQHSARARGLRRMAAGAAAAGTACPASAPSLIMTRPRAATARWATASTTLPPAASYRWAAG